MVYSGEDRILI